MIPSWDWPSRGPGTTGSTRRGGSPIRTASSPAGSPSWPTPSSGRRRSGATRQRGFRSVTLPERPHRINLPSLFSGYWDPIVAACEETDTVISLHVGSSGMADVADDSPMVPLVATLFGQMSLSACAEWLWSGLPSRFSNIKIAMSEGGIGWVAMLLDRLDNIVDRSGYGRDYDATGLRPAEVLARNFWFCTIDDPSTIDTRERIGSTTSWWKSTTRTATRRGRTPKRSSSVTGDISPWRTCAR